MNRHTLLFVVISVMVGLATMPKASVRGEAEWMKTTVTYRQIDGHKILADVYRPADETIRPVIVWLHGGALIMGHREGINNRILQLAREKGYALISFDYRLAPETKLPQLISDIEAAFQWLGGAGARQFHLDPQRIVVTGGSAGGYLTLITGYRVQPRPKGLVAFYGYGDLTGPWYSTPSPHPRHNPQKISREDALQQTDGTVISDSRERKGNGALIYLHYRQQGIWPQQVSGFAEESLAEKIVPYEPLRNVTADFPPTLLIHGTADTDVPYEQSQLMAKSLQEHEVPVILETIDNGEHGLQGGDPKQIEAAHERMQQFIVRHLEDK